MLILGTPTDPENYLAMDSYFSSALQEMNIHPKYRDGCITYFKKTEELEKAVAQIVSNL